MIQYTCDRCRRILDSGLENRFVVQIDVQVVTDSPAVDDESIDHLADLHESLNGVACDCFEADCSDALLESFDHSLVRGDDLMMPGEAALPGPSEADAASEPKQFDLCPECYAKYARNPLSRDRSLNLQFSDN